MNEEIERTVKLIVLRDVELKLLGARIEGMMIPDIVIEILRELEQTYVTPTK